MSDTASDSFLARHPKLMGVLFSMMLLLVSTGSASAAMTGALSGP